VETSARKVRVGETEGRKGKGGRGEKKRGEEEIKERENSRS